MAAATKPVKAVIKLQIPAGGATPAPPVGPALGQHKVNIMEFCKRFNEATRQMEQGILVPVRISVYADNTFDFVLKKPPASELIKRAAGIPKGASHAYERAGRITVEQLRRIAEIKQPDLNTTDLERAMRIIAGTARNMGVEIVEE